MNKILAPFTEIVSLYKINSDLIQSIFKFDLIKIGTVNYRKYELMYNFFRLFCAS